MKTIRYTFAFLTVVAFAGCEAEDGSMMMEPEQPQGLPVLGGNTHSIDNVEMTEIASSADGLRLPRDLEFNPERPDELWVINRTDHAVIILTNVGTDSQTADRRVHPDGDHFLSQPAALAFGQSNTFATIHEEDDFTQGPPPFGTPEDFMGPTLWSSKLNEFYGSHASHLDMLHNSPNGVGIAWDNANIYWVFDGYHNSITRYDFRQDHGLGGTDHSGADVARFAEGQVSYVADVPSHLALDRTTGYLFIADSGNNAIKVLNTGSGTKGPSVVPNYDGSAQYKMMEAQIQTAIAGADVGMTTPSGLEIVDQTIYVTDNASSKIFAFSTDGELIDWLDTGLPAGSLMGIEVDGQGRLLIVDAKADKVFRIAALTETGDE